MTAAWATWPDEVRECYKEWLEIVKPHAQSDLHAANWAFDRAEDLVQSGMDYLEMVRLSRLAMRGVEIREVKS
ncbi:MAG: hypothetical protein R3253_08935 [Longimicrobiales bacterium]|nr:hypothetical protein [Longimicrobiales bacterium]